MRPRRHKLQVSTFPFMAVLLCTMGSLLFILFAMDARAKFVARRKAQLIQTQHAAERSAAARPQPLPAPVEMPSAPIPPEIIASYRFDPALDNEIAKAAAALAATKTALTARLQKQQETAASLHAEQRQAASLREAALSKEKTVQETRGKTAGTTQLLQQWGTHLQYLEGMLRAAKQQANKEPAYSVVPYAGKRGDKRRPIYLECSRDKMIFHTQHAVLEGAQLTPQTVRVELEKRLFPNGSAGKDKTITDAYIMLLVRPDGIPNYYTMQSALVGLDIPFGYELVDASWTFDFPTTPEAIQLAERGAQQPTVVPSPPGPPRAGGSFTMRLPTHGPYSHQPQLAELTRPLTRPRALLLASEMMLARPGIGQTPGTGGYPGGVGSALGKPGYDGQWVAASSPFAGAKGMTPGLFGTGEGAAPGVPRALAGTQGGSPGASGTREPGVVARPVGVPLGLNSGAQGPYGPPMGEASTEPRGLAGTQDVPPGSPGAREPGIAARPGVPPGMTGATQGVNGSPMGAAAAEPKWMADMKAATQGQYKPQLGEPAAERKGSAELKGAAQGQPGPREGDAAGTPGARQEPRSPTAAADPARTGTTFGQASPLAGMLGVPAAGTAKEKGTGAAAPPAKKQVVPLGRLLEDRDWRIIIECRADKVVLPTLRREYGVDTLAVSRELQPAMARMILDVVQREQRFALPGAAPPRPVLHFHVYPDGLRSYYLAYVQLEPLQLPMVRENYGGAAGSSRND